MTEQGPMIDTYRRRAAMYDFTANLYYLVGFREWAYRRLAIDALALHRGDTVVEIGCGTGLNFDLLQQAVGPEGSIIGVDLTDAMLAQARKKITQHRWRNVELIQSDAATYQFPMRVDGVLSTFALSFIQDCGKVLHSGAAALRPGARWAVLDLKKPDRISNSVIRLLLPLLRPFAITEEFIARHPWDTIWQIMQETLDDVTTTELYFGCAYLSAGKKPDAAVH